MSRVAASLAFVLAIGTARAEPCEQEAAALREHLVVERHRTKRWNTAWAIVFGAATVAQVGFIAAEVNPTGGAYTTDTKETLYVGAAKSFLGVSSKIVMPLRVTVPSATGDACTDAAALRLALADAGRREARSFWLTHLGGLAVNLAGATVLTVRRSFAVGATSFALSFAVPPLSAYTQPRRSWDWWRQRRESWVVGASAGDGAQLWIGGQW